jgi:dextranase
MGVCSNDKEMIIQIHIEKVEGNMAGYGVEAELSDESGNVYTASTAFDVLKSWKHAPRYGFLSDFSLQDSGDEEDLREMNKLHINVVQFYDWMYRHHELLPPQNVFIDPLGRELSIDTVREKINYSHKYGMKALAYGAVYGAGKSFFEANMDMALYDNVGNPMGFGGFLYIMDISNKSGWKCHIIREFEKAIEFGFDGIHMDQYGFPKEAVSIVGGNRVVRRLKHDFPDFINDTKNYLKEKYEDICISFNAVNNWPVDTVAKSEEDCVYIEIWPPNDTYQDLYNIITNAKRYAPEKQVVLAAYIKSYSKEANLPLEYGQNSAIMTMAVIFASGGFHILLGEKNGILNDQYFPKYRQLEKEDYIREIRNYYDFIVRYEELLYDLDIVDNTMAYTGGINGEYTFKGGNFSPKAEADSIWTIIKEKPGYKIINLVNFTGVESMNWNEGKDKRPDVVRNIEIKALITDDVEGVYVASPDMDSCKSVKLDFKYVSHDQGRAISFTVPELRMWDLVYVVLK